MPIAAIVSRGGLPDPAGPQLALVRAPTLLIVGGSDEAVLRLNRQAQRQLTCESKLTVIPAPPTCLRSQAPWNRLRNWRSAGSPATSSRRQHGPSRRRNRIRSAPTCRAALSRGGRGFGSAWIGNYAPAGSVLAGDSEIMKPRFPHMSPGRSMPESGSSPPAPGRWPSPPHGEDRACCCPARPVVRVIMPPAPGRAHPVDLLLCGHHYRTSRVALAATGAAIEGLPGRAGAAQAALLGDPHQARAKVT